MNMGCEGIYDATMAVLTGGAQFEAGAPGERECANTAHGTAGAGTQTDATCHQSERVSSTVGVGAIDFVNPTGDTATCKNARDFR